ncbi:Receptor-type adenylate cyclase, partial [Diplonema papillatum]
VGEDILSQIDVMLGREFWLTHDVVVASDGGFLEDESRGSAGVNFGTMTFGCLLSGTVTSSTETELAAMILLATVLRRWDVAPERVSWYSDSEAAILRIRRKEPGDPVAGVVGEYEQSLRWGKGHSDNAYINGADEAATRALQERLPVLDVELLYRKNGVRAVCCYAAEDFPQLESPIRYVKRVWQYSRTKTATRSIRELASAETTKGSTLRSLETLPGAVDLLQAIIRRAVMPRATRVACKRCAALANAQHVLLADDATHNEVSDIRHAYPADPPHLKGLLADYAKKRRDTIRHVAKRVKVLCDDPLAARYSQRPGVVGVYEPLERLRLYTWASDSFVCRTFDEYPKLLAGTLRGETAPVDHSALVQNVVADYITAVSPVAYAVDGRMLVTTEGEHHLALRDTQQTCSGDTYWDAGVATCLACADGFEQNFPGDVSCQKTEPDYVGLALSIALPFLAVVLCLAGVWVVRSEMTKRKGVRNVANAPKGGQVTLIFTDVQDSTKLWGCCPAAMSYSLDLHHRIIRECIAEYRGYEVKTVGDCFMIAISDAGKGVALARDIQLRFQATQFPSAIAAVYGAKTDADLDAVADDPDDLLDLHPVWNGLRVRIGMHSGKPDVTFDEVTKGYDYYGPPVNVAARVEGVAKGGQIVATKDVTDEDWDPEELGIQVTALGSVELKGVANPVDVLEFSPNSIRGRVHSPLTAADNADVGPECDGKSFDGSDAGTFSSSHALNEPFKKFLSFAVRIAPPKDQERALDELCKLWRVGKHRDQEERIDALVRRVAPSMRKDIELSNPSLAVSVRRESGALARRESLRRHDVPRRRSSVKPPTPFLK